MIWTIKNVLTFFKPKILNHQRQIASPALPPAWNFYCCGTLLIDLFKNASSFVAFFPPVPDWAGWGGDHQSLVERNVHSPGQHHNLQDNQRWRVRQHHGEPSIDWAFPYGQLHRLLACIINADTWLNLRIIGHLGSDYYHPYCGAALEDVALRIGKSCPWSGTPCALWKLHHFPKISRAGSAEDIVIFNAVHHVSWGVLSDVDRF